MRNPLRTKNTLTGDDPAIRPHESAVIGHDAEDRDRSNAVQRRHIGQMGPDSERDTCPLSLAHEPLSLCPWRLTVDTTAPPPGTGRSSSRCRLDPAASVEYDCHRFYRT